ncbi:MAG: hypothetical protein QME07_07935, partial [bacterium]|nr:hypothetical protein [bacterium]
MKRIHKIVLILGMVLSFCGQIGHAADWKCELVWELPVWKSLFPGCPRGIAIDSFGDIYIADPP